MNVVLWYRVKENIAITVQNYTCTQQNHKQYPIQLIVFFKSGIWHALLKSRQVLAVANYERGSFQTQVYVLR